MSDFDVGALSCKVLKEMGVETWFAQSTTSTNTLAKDEALSLSTIQKVYLTNHQSAGRGRSQNSWSDLGAGSALLSSWSFAFSKPPQPVLVPLVGLCVFQNLARVFSDLPLALKAPNDILIGGKKLCGILIENIIAGQNGRSVIGIGLNVFNSPADLDAVHLSTLTDVTPAKWQKFLTELVRGLKDCMTASEQSEMNSETCEKLRDALNENPHLPEKVLTLTPRGSMIFKNKSIDWQSL